MNVILIFCRHPLQCCHPFHSSIPLPRQVRVVHKSWEEPHLYGYMYEQSILQIKGIFNFRSVTLPSTYLGTPLLLRCSRKSHFENLLASIRRKLSGWHASSISFAGRLVLDKHVLASMLLHIAMVFPFAQKCLLFVRKLYAELPLVRFRSQVAC